MAEQQAIKQPDGRKAKGRANHLKKFRFKKGQSGNPGGRRKGTVSLSALYAKQMGLKCPTDPKGRTFAEVIAEVMANKAAEGSDKHAKEMLDRIEGKPNQRIEQVTIPPDVLEVDLNSLTDDQLLHLDLALTKQDGQDFGTSSGTNGSNGATEKTGAPKANRLRLNE